MAGKRRSPSGEARTVTASRVARLVRLLQYLARGPQSRESLTRLLHCDVRSFYRDLVLLRSAGIELSLSRGHYALADGQDAIARLPFITNWDMEPGLTLGEARQLAQGRSEAHRKLKGQLDQILGSGEAARKRR